MPGTKITIAPYTPEFNPIERFFRTIKKRIPEGKKHGSLNDLMYDLVTKINKFEPSVYKSFFQCSLIDMGKFIAQKNDPFVAG